METTTRFVTLEDNNQAFTLFTRLLIHDQNYRSMPISNLTHLMKSIEHKRYMFLLEGVHLKAATSWSTLSQASIERCLKDKKEPIYTDLDIEAKGVYAESVVATEAKYLLRIIRHLRKIAADQPLLVARHFSNKHQHKTKLIVYQANTPKRTVVCQKQLLERSTD